MSKAVVLRTELFQVAEDGKVGALEEEIASLIEVKLVKQCIR